MPFEGLSRLSQLTAFASDYNGNARRGELYEELAPLTRLLKLDAPLAIQDQGKKIKDREKRFKGTMWAPPHVIRQHSWPDCELGGPTSSRWGRRQSFSHMLTATLLSATEIPATACRHLEADGVDCADAPDTGGRRLWHGRTRAQGALPSDYLIAEWCLYFHLSGCRHGWHLLISTLPLLSDWKLRRLAAL